MVWALRTQASTEEVNLHLVALEAAGLLGISEEAGRATVWLPERLAEPPVPGRWERVAEQDWNQAWKAGIEPVTVGDFTITPPWLAADPAAVVIDPGQAFGTGAHATTAACIEALQQRGAAGQRILDVGAGSGVLAICAARLGAAAVVAIDTDPLAVQASTSNAALNGAEVDVRHGSVETVAGERFDAVLANLDTATLCSLAADLAALLAPGGALIASGVSVEREGEAVEALGRAGLEIQVSRRGEWALLVGR